MACSLRRCKHLAAVISLCILPVLTLSQAQVSALDHCSSHTVSDISMGPSGHIGRTLAEVARCSALHWAALNNDLVQLRKLLQNSAGGLCEEDSCLNINARIASSDTPLHLAVSRDHHAAVEVLCVCVCTATVPGRS